MVNQEISRLFEQIADALEFKGENQFRVLAYRRGSEAVADLDEDLTVLVSEGRLTKIPGIGKGLASDIQEYLSRNHMASFDAAMEGIPPKLLGLRAIGGLGPKRLALFHRELGISDLHSLRKAMDDGSLAELPGLGPKMVENLQKGVERMAATRERMPLAEALALSREILAALEGLDGVSQATFAGSLRRCRETCGDLDLLVASRKGEAVIQAFTRLPGVEHVLAAGDTKGSALFRGSRQVDLRVVPASSFGAALCYFTGNKEHNVRLREIAKKKGLKVNEYGVFDGEKPVAGKTEKSVYAALDLPWIPPEMREDRGEIDAARAGKLPRVLDEGDIRGDLHLHTDWSNGTGSILDMVREAKARGYKYVAVTDHSAAAVYANGLTLERWGEQKAAIEKVRKAIPGIKILHGVEADIGVDGKLDLPDQVRKEADWVLAAVHTAYRQNVTERLGKAMEDPDVDAVAHPTGRLIGKRPGYEGLDLEAVLDAAAKTGTALEINSNPERMDLPAETARRAAERGVKLVVNSDAHSVEALREMELGVRVARRGWVAKEHVLNAGPVSKLRKKTRG